MKIFEDIFNLKQIDKDGKKFDKVSRIEARGEQFEMDLSLDVNVDIYPMEVGDKFALLLSDTLSLDGVPDDGTFDQSNEKSLQDQYDYVMYGKLYKFHAEKETSNVEIYVSFGGLLMRLIGDADNLKEFKLDQRLYILMKKL